MKLTIEFDDQAPEIIEFGTGEGVAFLANVHHMANRIIDQMTHCAFESQIFQIHKRNAQKLIELADAMGGVTNVEVEKLQRVEEAAKINSERGEGITNRLRQARLAHGYKQIEVAEQLCINQGYISLYERGEKVNDDVKEKIEQWLTEHPI